MSRLQLTACRRYRLPARRLLNTQPSAAAGTFCSSTSPPTACRHGSQVRRAQDVNADTREGRAHLMGPPAVSSLSGLTGCFRDAVERHVVHVHVAVRGPPGEGERGGVGPSQGQIGDCSRTCRRETNMNPNVPPDPPEPLSTHAFVPPPWPLPTERPRSGSPPSTGTSGRTSAPPGARCVSLQGRSARPERRRPGPAAAG